MVFNVLHVCMCVYMVLSHVSRISYGFVGYSKTAVFIGPQFFDKPWMLLG